MQEPKPMQIQYKEQGFQISAVRAVVDCFAGQPKETARFTLERSAELIRKAKLAAISEGKFIDIEDEITVSTVYQNRQIQITENQLLANVRVVQNANQLLESEKSNAQPKPAVVITSR